ncbi:MAG TPA: hypothetical protein VL360_04775 [Gammaproteobacteria bacterium]|jgi:hypothetical protein|nr:hypothetical protein [Gammaproteobacteria bacterium]
MVEINLLSWREKKKECERNRARILIIASVMVSLCIATVMHAILAAEVRRDQRRLQTASASLPSTDMTAQIENDVVQNAKLSANDLAKLLDDAAASAVSGMCFTNIAYHDNQWRLEGKVLTPLSLIAGLRALQISLNAMKLVEFKQIPERDYYQFILNTETLAARRGG